MTEKFPGIISLRHYYLSRPEDLSQALGRWLDDILLVTARKGPGTAKCMIQVGSVPEQIDTTIQVECDNLDVLSITSVKSDLVTWADNCRQGIRDPFVTVLPVIATVNIR